MRWEMYGLASTYGALDIETDDHADAVIAALTPLSEARTLGWEWRDPQPN